MLIRGKHIVGFQTPMVLNAKAPRRKIISLEPEYGHLPEIPFHDALQKVRG
jgi:hypothetical protein